MAKTKKITRSQKIAANKTNEIKESSYARKIRKHKAREAPQDRPMHPARHMCQS